MSTVTPDDFDQLKRTVHRLGAEMQVMMIDQAKSEGRIQSAEESIDRLRASSATSDQVTAGNTYTALKLDHLLEKQVDMKQQIGRSSRMQALLLLFWGTWLLVTALEAMGR